MRISFFRQIAGIASILCLIVACNNNGPNNETNKKVEKSRIENREEDVVIDALEINAGLKAWLKKATDMATDAELKLIARQLLEKQEKMETDLKVFADKRKFSVNAIDTVENIKLSEGRGIRWDEECADEIGDKHRQMIKRFERAQNYIENTELKNIITQYLPEFRSQLNTVNDLEARLYYESLSPIIK